MPDLRPSNVNVPTIDNRFEPSSPVPVMQPERPGVHRDLSISSTASIQTPLLDPMRSNQNILGMGSVGTDVQQLQQMLRQQGYNVADNGVFDHQMRQAVMDFQRRNGCSVDGLVGPETMRALDSSFGRPEAAPSSPVMLPTNTPVSAAVPSNNAPSTAAANNDNTVRDVPRPDRTNSSNAQAQMNDLLDIAKRNSQGRRPDGKCYTHVANFLDRARQYGNIGNHKFNSNIPGSHWAEARQFAEYANRGNNLEKLGLRKLDIDNPYDAPPGSIVVVRAGTPGTRHATAGDIAVKGNGDVFYNGGEMGYGGRHNFPPGNNYVLGIYAPAN
jgi:peptidoglycan hydrolase-like protein with peptidoglycan-binding domain